MWSEKREKWAGLLWAAGVMKVKMPLIFPKVNVR